LRKQLGIRNKELEVLSKTLKDTERKYGEATLDMRRSREEKQGLEDIVERLRRELDRTRNARDVVETQLARGCRQAAIQKYQLIIYFTLNFLHNFIKEGLGGGKVIYCLGNFKQKRAAR
jgi:hypothetical protein